MNFCKMNSLITVESKIDIYRLILDLTIITNRKYPFRVKTIVKQLLITDMNR